MTNHAVDREIDLSMLAERRQWNISCRRLRGRNLGCRNTNKTQPLPLPPGEAISAFANGEDTCNSAGVCKLTLIEAGTVIYNPGVRR